MISNSKSLAAAENPFCKHSCRGERKRAVWDKSFHFFTFFDQNHPKWHQVFPSGGRKRTLPFWEKLRCVLRIFCQFLNDSWVGKQRESSQTEFVSLLPNYFRQWIAPLLTPTVSTECGTSAVLKLQSKYFKTLFKRERLLILRDSAVIGWWGMSWADLLCLCRKTPAVKRTPHCRGREEEGKQRVKGKKNDWHRLQRERINYYYYYYCSHWVAQKQNVPADHA